MTTVNKDDLPGLTREERRAINRKVPEMLEVTKLLEASGITCCMVGVAALRYFGAWRVVEAWEVCIPSSDMDRAVEILTTPPNDLKYGKCPHSKIQPWSIHHTLPIFKVKDLWLHFYLIGSDDCHIKCVPENIERSQSGLPYPKLDVFAQSLLDTMDDVALTDLVDGMDLDNDWASAHLDTSGTQDITWAKAMNKRMRAASSTYMQFAEVPRSAKAFWDDIVTGKDSRIGLEFPPGVVKTRFRVIGQGDPRLTDRRWV